MGTRRKGTKEKKLGSVPFRLFPSRETCSASACAETKKGVFRKLG